MNHPHELLADLIDGTLDAEARARVDAHLATCRTCREDVAAATLGRTAARSLPERPAPGDLYRRVVADAGGRGAAGPPRWYRWAGVAAAAAVAVAIAIVLPEIGEDAAGPGVAQDAAAPAAPEEAATGGVRFESVDENLDEEALRRILRNASDREAQAVVANQAREAIDAAACVEQALQGPPPGELTRLIEARFEGRRARIAVYLEGPGAGQPPDTAVAYVASADGCEMLRVLQVLL